MSERIYATFDEEVFRPDKPVDLPKDFRVSIDLDRPADALERRPHALLDALERLTVEGPSDWSERFDSYLEEDRRGEEG